MDDRTVDEPPLIRGRGVMLIDEFSRVTGLDRLTVDALVAGRKIEGASHLDGRVFGIFDDVLPTREELRSWGLSVRDDYDPERHRSYVGVDEDSDAFGSEEGAAGSSASWTMSWDDDKYTLHEQR
ncbi:hypothetical protein [Nocardioides sp. W7]|uniref:hypothetical protein n=1 Tax=Nocardioides sp. W7 TaxID=2931390 RepID=UPI001FD074F3|nr:hypothetical protein [Nocardioides sp. W7]